MDSLFFFGGLACMIAAIILIMRTYPLPQKPGTCPGCGYELAGLVRSAICPECGRPSDAAPPSPRSRGVASSTFAVLLAAQSCLLIAVFSLTGNAVWTTIAILASSVPLFILFLVILGLRPRLNRRAALALTLSAMLAVTPLLATLAVLFPPDPRDAFAGVAAFFAAALSIGPLGIGLLLGALVIQIPWFKR